MRKQSMDERTIRTYFEAYADMIYRICFSYLKNSTDAEDALQETFLKLVRQENTFKTDEHVKAWLSVTATNHCKSQLSHWWQKRKEYDDTAINATDEYEHNDVMDAIMELPPKYKTVVYLRYYEGYNSTEIARILKKPAGTIRSYLHDSKEILKKRLQDPYHLQKGVRYE